MSGLVDLDVLDLVVANESTVVLSSVTFLLSELDGRLVSSAGNGSDDSESRESGDAGRKSSGVAGSGDDEGSSEGVYLTVEQAKRKSARRECREVRQKNRRTRR